jgi:uncharacterized membrane protein YraQ (UPF0718 family)
VTRRLPDWLVLIFRMLAIVVMIVVIGVWLEVLETPHLSDSARAVHAF